MNECDQNKLVAGLRELSVDIEKLHEHEQGNEQQQQQQTGDVETSSSASGSLGRNSKTTTIGTNVIVDDMIMFKDGFGQQQPV